MGRSSMMVGVASQLSIVCDACRGTIVSGSAFFQCGSCNNGGFSQCSTCMVRSMLKDGVAAKVECGLPPPPATLPAATAEVLETLKGAMTRLPAAIDDALAHMAKLRAEAFVSVDGDTPTLQFLRVVEITDGHLAEAVASPSPSMKAVALAKWGEASGLPNDGAFLAALGAIDGAIAGRTCEHDATHDTWRMCRLDWEDPTPPYTSVPQEDMLTTAKTCVARYLFGGICGALSMFTGTDTIRVTWPDAPTSVGAPTEDDESSAAVEDEYADMPPLIPA